MLYILITTLGFYHMQVFILDTVHIFYFIQDYYFCLNIVII